MEHSPSATIVARGICHAHTPPKDEDSRRLRRGNAYEFTRETTLLKHVRGLVTVDEERSSLEPDLSTSQGLDGEKAAPQLFPGNVTSGDLEGNVLPALASDDSYGGSIPSRSYDSDEDLQIQAESLDIVEHDQATMHTALGDFGLTPYAMGLASKPADPGSRSDVFRKKSRINSVIRGLSELQPDNFDLPPVALASQLVDLFFEHVYPLYPFVHRPSFMQRLNETYSGGQRDIDVPWQATLNLIFAFGSDYLDLSLAETYTMSQSFLQHATELILSVCFDTTTLEVVQALLLLSCHLQSNMQYQRVWTSIGTLYRVAQSLGLHMDPGSWRISPIEKEIRRRIWWGIYSLDRFTSLKCGRPPSINIESLPVEAPAVVQDEQITETGIMELALDSGIPCSSQFFNSMVQLAHIAESILVSISKDTPWSLPGRNANAAETAALDPIHFIVQLAIVMEQEGKLRSWLDNLPDHLKFGAVHQSEKIRRQQSMLRVRYLHTRLMTHRQNLLSLIQCDRKRIDSLEDDFLRTVVMGSIRTCTQCACDITEMVKNSAAAQNMGPWWYNVQFLFTSLGILFAVQMRATITQHVDIQAVTSAVDGALDYLRFLGDVNGVVTRCRSYFESLRTRTETRKRSPRGPTMNETAEADHEAGLMVSGAMREGDNIGLPFGMNGNEFDHGLDHNHHNWSETNFDGTENLEPVTADLFLDHLMTDLDFDFS
ncbi:Fungal specific transcription factor domain-containing protein [Cladophialophora immunda]|nr:Fungal specific transcription factor domain-containing protein [Cladophialophora immunda]